MSSFYTGRVTKIKVYGVLFLFFNMLQKTASVKWKEVLIGARTKSFQMFRKVIIKRIALYNFKHIVGNDSNNMFMFLFVAAVEIDSTKYLFQQLIITTYVYTYIHTRACTHIPTHIRTYIHTCVRTYVRTYMHTHTHTHTYIHTCILLQSFRDIPGSLSRWSFHTYVYLPTYMYLTTYPHINTHIYIYNKYHYLLFPVNCISHCEISFARLFSHLQLYSVLCVRKHGTCIVGVQPSRVSEFLHDVDQG